MKLRFISATTLLISLPFSAASSQYMLDNVHAFNIQRVKSEGLAASTERLAVSNMPQSANHQVPLSSIEFQGEDATITMSSGAIVVVMRNNECIIPHPDDLLCLEKRFPVLDIKTQFKPSVGDIVLFVHPLNHKWAVKPVDFTGAFGNQDFDAELITGFLKFSENFWDVAMVGGVISKNEKKESPRSIIWVPAPKSEEKPSSSSASFPVFILNNLLNGLGRHGVRIDEQGGE